MPASYPMATNKVAGDPGFITEINQAYTNINDLDVRLSDAAINVMQQYGAVGDNATNDAAEIQAALDAAETAGGGVVLLPVGTFLTGSTTLSIPQNVQLVGLGKWVSTINYTGTGTAIQMKDPGTSEQKLGVAVHHIGLTAPSAAVGINAKGMTLGSIRYNFIQGAAGNLYDTLAAETVGILLDGSYGGSVGCWWNIIEHNHIEGWDACVVSDGASGAGQANANTLRDNFMRHFHVGHFVRIGDTNLIEGNDFTSRVRGFNGVVTNKALTSNVATLTVSRPHGLDVGYSVTVAAVDATFNGTYTVTAVPTGRTFSYAKVAADVASASSTGTVTHTGTATVSNKALTSNVATITTSAAHGFVKGHPVTVSSVDSTFNGDFIILDTPTSTTFTYTKTAADVASVAATGSAYIHTAIGIATEDPVTRAIGNRFEQCDVDLQVSSAGAAKFYFGANSCSDGTGVYLMPSTRNNRGTIVGNAFADESIPVKDHDTSLSTDSGKFNFYGGSLVPVVLYRANVAASLSGSAMDIAGCAGLTAYAPGKPYQIRGISIRSSEARTAGTLTVRPTIGGTESATLSAVLDGTNTTARQQWQAMSRTGGTVADLHTTGSSGVGAKITTDGSWAPTTADLMVTVWIEFIPVTNHI